MAGGRPSKYKPAYCNEVRSFMATGYSITAFAGEIGVSRESVYEWERSIPEFSDALKEARAKRVLALETKLLSSAIGPAVTAAIFALKNAAPEDWRDVHHTKSEVTIRRADEMSDDDLARIAAGSGAGIVAPPVDTSKLN